MNQIILNTLIQASMPAVPNLPVILINNMKYQHAVGALFVSGVWCAVIAAWIKSDVVNAQGFAAVALLLIIISMGVQAVGQSVE